MIYEKFLSTLDRKLEYVFSDKKLKPTELYEPQNYILSLGGKRIRPLLALIASDLFGSDYKKAMPAALCVELFHNFSLIHDDILDKAPLRRGKQTVHKKWNTNIAILSGDAMLVRSYIELNKAETKFRDSLNKIFSKTAIEVCEGQQDDMNFETSNSVSVQQYKEMITKKTAILLACSLQMGAVCANAKEKEARLIYNCGKHLGIAFQIKDDLLDAFGDQNKFGKQVGGDIISNKKTFLLLKALELANTKQNKELKNWISLKKFNKKAKVNSIIRIFDEIGIRELTQKEIDLHFKTAITTFNKIESIEFSKKEIFINFCVELMNREK